MALKPIYSRSPLVDAVALPLYPGQIRTAEEAPAALYRLCGDSQDLFTWEAAFRLSALCCASPLLETPAVKILTAMEQQRDDGSLPLEPDEAAALVSAAWAVCSFSPDKALAERLTAWCAWAGAHWSLLAENEKLMRSPAALMRTLTGLYRQTGLKGVAGLCRRLRESARDLSGYLSTYSNASPEEDLIRLADGAAMASVSGSFSGSRQEQSAPAEGYERLCRQHGAPCGGLYTPGNGRNPYQSLEAGAQAAWTEVLCRELAGGNSLRCAPWAERLLVNALPACLNQADAWERFGVNGEGKGKADIAALNRLAAAWAAACEYAVTTLPDGACIHLYLNGVYTLRLGNVPAQITLERKEGGASLQLETASPVKAVLKLRLPAWMEGVTVNGKPVADRSEDRFLTINREWKTGDRVILHWQERVATESGWHQGLSVYQGPVLMAVAPETAEGKAVTDQPLLRDGQVLLPLIPVADAVPGKRWTDLPVLPQVTGEAVLTPMQPFAQLDKRAAAFPGGRR